MKISLVGWRGNSLNIFPELVNSLSQKISGVEVLVRFVPFFEDIPIVCVEESASSDFIVVYANIDDFEDEKFLKNKLVDVELLTKTRILKWIGDEGALTASIEDYFNQREKLVNELSDTIVGILFRENNFVPIEEQFE